MTHKSSLGKPDLDLYHDNRVPIKLRGHIRESAARLCEGQVTLGYFVEQVRNTVLDDLIEKVKAEPFFPNADGPTHGNAAAFRDYERRIKRIIENMRRG